MIFKDFCRQNHEHRGVTIMDMMSDYGQIRDMLKGERMPLAFVDLEAFDANVAYVAGTQAVTGKTIRVASKSVRCIALIRRIFEKGKGSFKGILAFTMEEAAFLIQNGFDDIVVAYPAVGDHDLKLFAETVAAGADVCMMIDGMTHAGAVSRTGKEYGLTLPVCLDVDMSFSPVGKVHLGVRRSPVRTASEIIELFQKIRSLEGIVVKGLMGYEAQIASVNDNFPKARVRNHLLRFFKKWSSAELTRRRGRIVAALKTAGASLSFVNGGGSGSLVSTGKDASVTEVSAGSAFFCPGLFRYFHEVSFKPAAFFALQVSRIPGPGMITCQGGGYVGSGEANKNRLPWPVLPKGLSYLPMEGAGEVQTPLILPRDAPEINIGDPVVFQHAKAGELCERFNELALIQNGKITGTALTYRGQGQAFL
jgi:D-serine deaminase-like pyridoxal phosphate-dependent protein